MKGGHPIQPDPTAHQRMGGNPAEQERNSGTQPDADQNRRRREAPLVRSQQRTAQRPFGRLALLQLNRDRAASVRHHADRRVLFRSHNPEASDERTQDVCRFVEFDLGAIDDTAADAYFWQEAPAEAGPHVSRSRSADSLRARIAERCRPAMARCPRKKGTALIRPSPTDLSLRVSEFCVGRRCEFQNRATSAPNPPRA